MTKMEALLLKVFLKRIRVHQDRQKKWGERAWSMNYISVGMHALHYHMAEELDRVPSEGYSYRFIGIKRTYALSHRLKDMGLVRFKKYKYKGTFLYLTEEGVEYVKRLKSVKS